jgi:hypothetical protein
MKRVYGAVAAAALLSAGSAWAVKVGENLFVKTQGVKLLKEAKATSAPVSGSSPLKVGDSVVWKGPDATDKTFHKVEFGKLSGFVLMTSLSPNKPTGEIAEAGKAPIDTKAFASSGAATKGLTPAALAYTGEKPDLKKSAVQVIYAEEHNKNKGTPDAIAMKSKELGGGK